MSKDKAGGNGCSIIASIIMFLIIGTACNIFIFFTFAILLIPVLFLLGVILKQLWTFK